MAALSAWRADRRSAGLSLAGWRDAPLPPDCGSTPDNQPLVRVKAARGNATMTAFRDHHRREADRLRSFAATATTDAIKVRLLEEAENHERVTQIAEDLELVEQEAGQS